MMLYRFVLLLFGAVICTSIKPGSALAAGKNIVLAQSTISEKEAFEGAKELGTIEAWEAFLNSYPKGFRADLARAYVKRVGSGGNAASAPAPVQTATPPAPPAPRANNQPPALSPAPALQPVHLGPGTSPWRNGNYAMDEGNASAYSASVQSSGLELITYCSAGRQLNVVLSENQRGVYPDFDQRIKQGLAASQGQYGTPEQRISIRFSNNSEHNLPANVMGLTGEVEIASNAPGKEFQPGGRFINDMMSARSMTLSSPPFGATFQLTGSRLALCNVLKSCGVSTPGCARFAPAPVSTYAPPPRIRTYTPPPTYRKKKTYTKKKKTGCPGGTVWLEGQCIKNSQVTSFCGPGYKRSGSRCVSRYPATAAQPPARQNQQPNLAPAIQLLQGIAGAIQQQKSKKKSAPAAPTAPGPTAAPPPKTAPGPTAAPAPKTATAPKAPDAPPEPPTQVLGTKKKCAGGLVPGKNGGCVLPTCGPGQQATINGCVTISDARLKRDIAHIATLDNGIRLYAFRYLWDDTARIGVMAQDLLADERVRHVVIRNPAGYYAVNYAALGLRMASAEEWRARGLASVQINSARTQPAAMPVEHIQ